MTMRGTTSRLRAGAAIIALLLPSAAHAQATGAISGACTDKSGAALPGVSVAVTNIATGQARTVTSRPDGLYSVPLLQPGTYKVTASLQGFASLTRDGAVTNTRSSHPGCAAPCGAAYRLTTSPAAPAPRAT